eukprot:9485975-Pyramimonas_sp.AAC.1
MTRTIRKVWQTSSDLCMRQGDASDVSEAIPAIASPAAPPTARVKCRKPTAPLRVTRTIRIVSRT